jgi:hypothetical protein
MEDMVGAVVHVGQSMHDQEMREKILPLHP